MTIIPARANRHASAKTKKVTPISRNLARRRSTIARIFASIDCAELISDRPSRSPARAVDQLSAPGDRALRAALEGLACCSRLSRPALSVATTDPFDKCGLGEPTLLPLSALLSVSKGGAMDARE